MEQLKYSNPRMTATIENWPSGSKRVTARFEIEQAPKGERAVRTTNGDPKKLTYAKYARIVDGSDVQTFLTVKALPYRVERYNMSLRGCLVTFGGACIAYTLKDAVKFCKILSR